jgi:hypothetical protein
VNKSPLAATKALLFSVAEGSPSERAKGCLGVQSISDFGTEDPEIVAIGKTSLALFRSTLERILAEPKSMGEDMSVLVHSVWPLYFFDGCELCLRVRIEGFSTPL